MKLLINLILFISIFSQTMAQEFFSSNPRSFAGGTIIKMKYIAAPLDLQGYPAGNDRINLKLDNGFSYTLWYHDRLRPAPQIGDQMMLVGRYLDSDYSSKTDIHVLKPDPDPFLYEFYGVRKPFYSLDEAKKIQSIHFIKLQKQKTSDIIDYAFVELEDGTQWVLRINVSGHSVIYPPRKKGDGKRGPPENKMGIFDWRPGHRIMVAGILDDSLFTKVIRKVEINENSVIKFPKRFMMRNLDLEHQPGAEILDTISIENFSFVYP